MSLTNCELCGKIMKAAETSTGVHLKSFCGCDRKATMNQQPNKTGPKLGTGGKLNNFDKSSQKH